MKDGGEVLFGSEPIERFATVVGDDAVHEAVRIVNEARRARPGGAVWHVNSTAVGGGVAELLRALLPYLRGLGVDTHWVVLRASPAFFGITKRLHYALHGDVGDSSALGPSERAVYEDVMGENLEHLLPRVRPADVVVLHDPQTVGMAPQLRATGAAILWRCHIGADTQNEHTRAGWAFLDPYLRSTDAFVFSRAAYIPPTLDRARCKVITPSIDPFATKNRAMNDDSVRAILTHVGLLSDAGSSAGDPMFVRDDGCTGRVDRRADVVRLGPPPPWEKPLVAQVSRWDSLKDPLGVLHAFTHMYKTGARGAPELLLVGPDINAVADDPDGAAVFQQVFSAWRALGENCREHVQLVNLPTVDIEENAAIVNAIQRHATVVVQKSLREGFGLTVTEAMWKARPVIASAVGGIRDQIDDGVDGLLLNDPCDLDEFGHALRRVLDDDALARRLGAHAEQKVRAKFLGIQQIREFAALVLDLATRFKQQDVRRVA